jgi:hemerythrin-like domain-containing protein
MPNALTMLKADHATLKRLLRELSETGNRATRVRTDLVARIEQELKTHAQLEEEIFYPAFKKAVKGSEAEDLFFEAAEEHHVADLVLPELKSANPKTDEFKAKATVFRELIEHHIKEEEGEMFAEARKRMSEEQLRALGDTMKERRETIVAMWESPVLRPVKKLQSRLHKMMPTKVKTVKAAAMERISR